MRYSEENIFAMLERIGESAGCPVSTHETHRQIKMKDGFWPNLCFDIKFHPGQLEGQIKVFKHNILQGLTPSVLMCKPGLISAEMSDMFKSFASGNAQWAAMTMEMKDWDYTETNEFLEINQVFSESDLRIWCDITNESLLGGSEISAELFLKLKDDPDFTFLIARSNGQPVAGSMSFQSNGKAGLYLISTLKTFRGNGSATTITVAAVNHLKKQGVQEIHLQATSSGEPIYAKLGFVRHGNIDVFNLK